MVHGVPQGLLSLTDGIDEPLGRIDLLLDEHDGLFLFLVFLAAGLIVLHHLAELLANPQFRCIPGVEFQLEFAVVVDDGEVGDDVLVEQRCITLRGITRFGIALQDLIDHFLQLLIIHLERLAQFLVVLLGELFEVFIHYRDGFIHRFGMQPSFQLQQQALTQIAGTHTRRIESLYHVQQFEYLFFGGHHILREGQVIDNGSDLSSQISIIVYTANELSGDGPFPVVHLHHTQLLDEVLMKGLGYRYRYGTALFFVVGIVTVALGLVVGVIIVVQVLAQVQFIAGIAVFPLFLLFFVLENVVGLLLEFSRFFQGRIGLQFLFDALFELIGRYLQQLHKLYLLRRQLLQEFLAEFLVEHYSGKGTMGM